MENQCWNSWRMRDWTERSIRDRAWDVDYGGSVGGFGGEVVDGGDYTLGVEMPFGEEAIGGEAAVEWAGGDAVEIGDVGADDCAEAIEIEMGVACFEGIERPFDEADIAGEGFFALEEFERAADLAIAIFGEDAGHVGVEIGDFVADADDSHGEADHGVAVERAEDLAAGLVGDDEGDVGFGFEVGFVPDEFLDFDAAVEVCQRGAVADLNVGGHESRLKASEVASDALRVARIKQKKGTTEAREERRAHREGLRSIENGSWSGASGAEAVSSRCLDWFQRDSSWGRGISARVAPCSRAIRSISRKRRENLALAFFMASSGST